MLLAFISVFCFFPIFAIRRKQVILINTSKQINIGYFVAISEYIFFIIYLLSFRSIFRYQIFKFGQFNLCSFFNFSTMNQLTQFHQNISLFSCVKQ